MEWTSPSFETKLVGTLISLIGAISLTLYKGPVIKYPPSPQLHLSQRLFVFSSTHENWILGAILLAAASFTISIWNIIQIEILKKYPKGMIIVSFYSLFGTIQSAVLSLLVERNPSAWSLKINMDLLVIILTALFSSVIRSHVQIWCIRRKDPFYVPMFKPMGIPIATICGCLFFAYSFHCGSIMGATIVGMGYYIVIWEQIREDKVQKNIGGSDLSEEKIPLLEEDVQL